MGIYKPSGLCNAIATLGKLEPQAFWSLNTVETAASVSIIYSIEHINKSYDYFSSNLPVFII